MTRRMIYPKSLAKKSYRARKMRFTEKLAKKAYRVGASIIEIDIYRDNGNYDSTLFSFEKPDNSACSKISYGRHGKIIPTAYVSYPLLNEKIKISGDMYPMNPMNIRKLLNTMDRVAYRCKYGRNDARFFFDIPKKVWYVTDWETNEIIYSIKQR